MKRVIAKLGKRRKAEGFVVYPVSRNTQDNRLLVQSDKTIGKFDPETGEGIINDKGSNHKGFAHLVSFLGARPYTFPSEFVKACVEAQPKTGDEIVPGSRVFIG